MSSPLLQRRPQCGHLPRRGQIRPLLLSIGKSIYGGDSPRDLQQKFDRPYASLLSAGVKFYAALGNHDALSQRFYPPFNMRGQKYYFLSPGPGVRIIALDSSHMDAAQVRWLERELSLPALDWTIVFMHHPLYSSGKRHGPSLDLRLQLEPLFLGAGVNAVFAGHEHFYERQVPHDGVHYFISGAAGQLRKGNIAPNATTACGFDRDNSFMLIELRDAEMRFEVVARDGRVVDSGAISNRPYGPVTPFGCLAEE